VIGDIRLTMTVNDRMYSITELLSPETFDITENTLVVSNDVYEQLYRMLRRICDQCYVEEIMCKI